MNRNTTRRVHKLTGQEIKDLEYKSMLKGIKGTMKIYEGIIRKELGFGDKRFKRLEDAVRKELGMEVEDE